jgi:hypothetical protein
MSIKLVDQIPLLGFLVFLFLIWFNHRYTSAFGLPKWQDDFFKWLCSNPEEPLRALKNTHKQPEQIGLQDETLPDKSSAPRCVVCISNKVQTVITDCGHSCLCFGCATVFGTVQPARCPKCRTPISKIIRIFLEN